MPLSERYRKFNTFVKNKFGHKVYKVSVDAGFTCPNRDGKVAIGGCVYCNNDTFVPPYARRRYSIEDQIKNGMDYLRLRYKAEKFIIYFQAYTNTYGDVNELKKYYEYALTVSDDIVGLTIGTRSDCIDEEKLDMLQELAEDIYLTVEYGLESIYDKTLRFANRGHDYDSVKRAIERTRNRNISIGAHIIAGFPTETVEETLESASEISSLNLDFLKIHNLHVVRNTALQRMYKESPFHLFTYEEYVDFVINYLERLSPDIVIERLYTDTPRQLLIAPLWGVTHMQILQGIERELESRDTYQGRLYDPQII